MTGNAEICCTVQIRGYLRTQYSLGKLSLHQNSISIRLKKWNFVGGIHQFMLFALYSHLEISIVEREIRFFETGNFFPVFKWPIRVFPWFLIFFYRTKFTIDWLLFLKHNFSKVCLLSVPWNNAHAFITTVIFRVVVSFFYIKENDRYHLKLFFFLNCHSLSKQDTIGRVVNPKKNSFQKCIAQ